MDLQCPIKAVINQSITLNLHGSLSPDQVGHELPSSWRLQLCAQLEHQLGGEHKELGVAYKEVGVAHKGLSVAHKEVAAGAAGAGGLEQGSPASVPSAGGGGVTGTPGGVQLTGAEVTTLVWALASMWAPVSPRLMRWVGV